MFAASRLYLAAVHLERFECGRREMLERGRVELEAIQSAVRELRQQAAGPVTAIEARRIEQLTARGAARVQELDLQATTAAELSIQIHREFDAAAAAQLQRTTTS